MKKLTTILFWCLAISATQAQDLVYKPKNPAFGGDTFNYQWLQSSAQAQNNFKDPSLQTTSTRNNLDDFQETLNRSILSTLSRQIVANQFGDDGLKPGSYVIGNFSVEVTTSLDGLVVDILDQSTGQTTQVVIPFF